MKRLLPLVVVLLLAGGSIASASRYVRTNGGPTRSRIMKMFKGGLHTQNRLTAADVDGARITAAAAEKARQSEVGYEGYHNTKATTYVMSHTSRAGNPIDTLVTVSQRINPATSGGTSPMARFFVARSGKTGKVVGRGFVTRDGAFRWTRGRNGDGLPERNRAE